MPNPAFRGQAVTALATASPDAEEVTVRWPWGERRSLTPADAGRRGWRGQAAVPAAFPPGRHPVLFTARRGQRTATVEVVLEVRPHPLEEVEFVLTD